MFSPQSPAGGPYKSPGTAAVLSAVFSGLGQIYNGQFSKAVCLILAYGLLLLLTLSIPILGLIGVPILLVLWIWGIVDAYKAAVRLNNEAAAGRPEVVPSALYTIIAIAVPIVLLTVLVIVGIMLLGRMSDDTIKTLF